MELLSPLPFCLLLTYYSRRRTYMHSVSYGRALSTQHEMKLLSVGRSVGRSVRPLLLTRHSKKREAMCDWMAGWLLDFNLFVFLLNSLLIARFLCLSVCTERNFNPFSAIAAMSSRCCCCCCCCRGRDLACLVLQLLELAIVLSTVGS